MSIITEFKVCPDYRATAVDLFGRLLVAMAVRGPYSEDHLVEWTGLERVCDRFVAAARAINHPIGIHSPEFWPTWRRFVERNEKIDSALRRAGPRAAPSGAQIDESDEIVSAPEMPADVKAKLGIADLPAAAPGAFRDLIFRPDLDNGTTITSIRTQWGEDEALIGRSDDAPPTVESAPVPAQEPAAAPTANLPQAQADDDQIHCETLAEAIKDRLDGLARKLGDRRGDESHGRVLKFALDFLGDRPLTSVSARDLRALEAAFTQIPNRTGIPKAAGKTLFMRYQYGQELGLDGLPRLEGLARVGFTTLFNTYYGCANSFLEWARTKTDWQAPSFIFNAESTDAPAPQQRDAFRDDELLRFFALPLFTGCESPAHMWQPGACFIQNDLYWGYIIHILLGLRPSEIGKLLTTDLVRDGDVWFIDMRRLAEAVKVKATKQAGKKPRRLKTENAHRRVPVPRLLIDLGLLDRQAALEKRGETRLFPDWTIYRHPQSGREMYGHFLSKSWQYVKVEHKFEREFLTLYSGRHTLAGWYDAMNLPQRIRDRLLGHAPQNVQGEYGPIDLTLDEARLALGTELQIELDIADLLLTAKLKAELGMLIVAPITPNNAKT